MERNIIDREHVWCRTAFNCEHVAEIYRHRFQAEVSLYDAPSKRFGLSFVGYIFSSGISKSLGHINVVSIIFYEHVRLSSIRGIWKTSRQIWNASSEMKGSLIKNTYVKWLEQR